MKYIPPHNNSDPDASYWDANPMAGRKGAPVPAEAIEHPMREIVHCIMEAGLVPDDKDLTQLSQAIRLLMPVIELPDPFMLCEFYYFRSPTLKPGFQPAQGGLLTNAATLYPAAWEYLQTAEGQQLCKSEAEWQAMTKATWATLADGTKVGWDGIGGAPFYAPDYATGNLRLPDLRGMYAEAAGYDTLGVGDVHGDAIRNIKGGPWEVNRGYSSYGLSTYLSGNGVRDLSQGGLYWYYMYLDASRAVPTANANRPRAWGALACVYLGAPK